MNRPLYCGGGAGLVVGLVTQSRPIDPLICRRLTSVTRATVTCDIAENSDVVVQATCRPPTCARDRVLAHASCTSQSGGAHGHGLHNRPGQYAAARLLLISQIVPPALTLQNWSPD